MMSELKKIHSFLLRKQKYFFYMEIIHFTLKKKLLVLSVVFFYF